MHIYEIISDIITQFCLKDDENMGFHTDLALEMRETAKHPDDGIAYHRQEKDGITVTRIEIQNERGQRELQRPKGNYITIECERDFRSVQYQDLCIDVLCETLKELLCGARSALICGIGNRDITPDALGPMAAARILATRHISKQLSKSLGLGELTPVTAVSPGVLGQTGIEVGEIIGGIIEKTQPDAVIAVDALAARNLSRLCSTVQISDTGITPGSGVHNARAELSRTTLGVPVISIGVPTVVDLNTLVCDTCKGSSPVNSGEMIVTPREIDTIIDHAADVISMSINCALQPHISRDDIASLIS